MDDILHPEQYFAISEEIPLRVIKVDPKNKRIVLSVGAYLKTRSEDEVRAFMERHPKKDIVIPPPSAETDEVDAELIAGVEEALEE
jgi:ribosomal protein S1